ncbi:transporter substrate-binding domain-containing protein [Hyalangium versicolor]|uniref:transporter substrate-binding domain-containing protein n=1 Tax=Hyalangium versicolor TaxID=2861190 RepID=UPI001CCE5CEC|nr:transporter substrate-binding domain-containing protein [Hyalangium versicolor]
MSSASGFNPFLSRWWLLAALALFLACERSQPPAPPPPAPVAAPVTPPAPEPEDPIFPETPPPPPAQPALEPEPPKSTGDLAAIRASGALRVLVEGTDEDFLPRQGMPKAQDRLLLERFAEKQGLTVEFIQAPAFDQLIPMLREGRGDVIAADLTVTSARAKEIAFTRPLRVVSEFVVGKRGAADLPRKPEQLAGRTVHVRESNSFVDSLKELAQSKAPGLVIAPVPESTETEEIVYQVSRGELPLTVADSHLLAAIETYNPDVERLFPIAEGRQIAWAVRQENPELRLALDSFITEHVLTEYAAERFTGDLPAIRKRGVLRVLTRNNPVTYFLHRGEQHGFDFELAKTAAEQMGVRLEIVVPPSRDLLIPWLNEGRGDVIAASLTVTPERSAEVAFSRPYLFVDEVLVQRAEGPKLASLAELKGQKIHVRASSSYHSTLLALQKAHGPFEIVQEPEEVETEALLDRTAEGEIPFTVADSHLFAAEQAYRDGLEVAFPLPVEGTPASKEGSRAIAFAVRKDATKLRGFFDGFVKKMYRGTLYNMWRKRYFENSRRVFEAKVERVEVSGTLSPYDLIFQSYSSRYGMDWRLMAAQAYQESRFNPKLKSWVGAIGLFQVMPATGRSLGFRKLEDPDQGTHAGVMYMQQLVNRFEPEIPFKHRLRFALASYNAGMGHVQDARRIAKEKGWNPNKWFGNVEKAMLLLERPEYYRRARYGYCRGSEPVKYVSEIQNRYTSYVELIPH